MARLRWAERCRAHRKSDGEACGNWAARGAFVCPVHGGSAPQVRRMAELRLEQSRIRRAWLRRAVVQLQQPLDGPEDTLAWLREQRQLAELQGVSLRTRRTVSFAEREERRLAAEDRELERQAAERDRRAG